MNKASIIAAITLMGVVAAGCTSTRPTTGSAAGDGAVVGGLAGAAVGGLASGTWGGAAIGAGVGAVGGAIIADRMSKRCYWVDASGQRHYVACR